MTTTAAQSKKSKKRKKRKKATRPESVPMTKHTVSFVFTSYMMTGGAECVPMTKRLFVSSSVPM